MSKIIHRLLTFFIGLPLVIFIVWFPFLNHILFHLLVVTFACISSSEIYNLLKKNLPMQKKGLVVTLSTVIPISAFFCALFSIDFVVSTLVFISGFMFLIVTEVFWPNPKDSSAPFADSNKKLTASLFVLLYGGYLLSFISRMTVLTHSTEFIISFFVMVFLCDSAAWFFGILFGKNNRGFVKASPNKSIAGFIGGVFGSVASGVLCALLWPDVFSGPLWRIIILGIIVAISAILGDLAESVFKRSAKEKDSGHTIPGRGGALDSIDSILMVAPLFYFIITTLFVK